MVYLDYIIRSYTADDADALAKLFNESQEGWPGGFTGGARLTGEKVHEWLSRSNNMLILVAEAGGEIVGFMQLTRHWADPYAGYVKLLNVHPRYRGRGIGTRLLKGALEAVMREGLLRLDLHTWGGNERALRLYKKMGFMWVPGTSVYMQNYLPSLALFPGFRDLVEDWSRMLAFEKNFEPKEDGVERHGRKVFLYRWGDGRMLVADYRSWRVCGAYWGEGGVEVWTREKVLRGFSEEMLGIVEGVEVAGVWSSEGVEVGGLESGGGRVKARFRVKPGVRRMSGEEPRRAVGLLVAVGGRRAVVASGFEDFEPLEVEAYRPAVLPRRGGELSVSLVNRSGTPITVSVPSLGVESRRVEGGDGLTLELRAGGSWPEYRKSIFYIASRGDEEGVFHVDVAVPVDDAWRVGYTVDRDHLVVALGGYLAKVSLKGGRVSISRRGRGIVHLSEAVGPPTWPNIVENKRFDITLSEREGMLVAELTAYLEEIGAVFRKRVTFARSTPRLFVEYFLRAYSDGERVLSIDAWGSSGMEDEMVIPILGNLVGFDVLPGETAPGRYVMPFRPREYCEEWGYKRYVDGVSVATAWSREGLENVGYSWSSLPSLRYKVHLKRGEEKRVAYYAVDVGEFPWSHARSMYLRLGGEKRCNEFVRELEPVLSPSIIAVGARETIEVEFTTWRKRGTRGRIIIKNTSLNIDENREFYVDADKRSEKIRLVVEAREHGVYPLEVVVDSTHRVEKRKLYLAALWGQGSVRIRGGEVDNGLVSFKVDPEYMGVLYSLTLQGFENMYTPYPTPGTFEWLNPWYGGVQLDFMKAQLWREKWKLRRIVGDLVSGVESSTVISRLESPCRGLEVKQQFLTMPNSNLLLYRLILENRTGRIIEAEPYVYIYVKPGGRLRNSFKLDAGPESYAWRRHGEVYDEPYKLSKQGFAYIGDEEWGVAAIAASSDLGVGVMCYGERGCHFWLQNMEDRVSVKPGETVAREAYIVLKWPELKGEVEGLAPLSGKTLEYALRKPYKPGK